MVFITTLFNLHLCFVYVVYCFSFLFLCTSTRLSNFSFGFLVGLSVSPKVFVVVSLSGFFFIWQKTAVPLQVMMADGHIDHIQPQNCGQQKIHEARLQRYRRVNVDEILPVIWKFLSFLSRIVHVLNLASKRCISNLTHDGREESILSVKFL